jgi:hypothetical protein
MRIIRTTNPNGTYRYEIDGELHTKASKVLYTHISAWTVGGPEFVCFHKTRAAADKAPGSPRNGWVKTRVIAIEDGDAAATAPAIDEPSPVVEPLKVPRVRAKVKANAGPYHVRGRQGRVQSKGTGDDGNLYITVDFGNDVTWPFLVSELEEIVSPAATTPNGRRCQWCGEPLTGSQRKFCSRSCTVRQQNRSRARNH